MERLPLSRLKALNVVTNIEDGYFTIREDFFKILIEKYLDGLDLDDRWYVDKYLDVKKAVRTGNTKSAKEHLRGVTPGKYRSMRPGIWTLTPTFAKASLTEQSPTPNTISMNLDTAKEDYHTQIFHCKAN